MLRKPRLFTAGPTPVHPDAVLAGSAPLPYHRTEAFTGRFERAQDGLREVFRTDGPVAVLAASGTGGMEAALVNLFEPGDRVAVVTGGKFGERWVHIAMAYGFEPLIKKSAAGEAASPEDVAAHLDENGPVEGLLLTASETSTATMFDVEGIAAVVRQEQPDVAIVVDAITALGAMPVETDAWGLDAVVGGAQKAFMIPPGLAFVACSPRGWERVQRERATPRFYFDLRRYAGESVRRQIPFTPAIGLILQLEAALDALREAGGVSALEANASRLAGATRAACSALELELLSKSPSPAVTAVLAPRPGSAPEVVARMRDRYGAQLSGGQGDLKPDLFRIGHLGYFDDIDLLGLLGALEQVLMEMGHDCRPGTGVAIAAADLATANVAAEPPNPATSA